MSIKNVKRISMLDLGKHHKTKHYCYLHSFKDCPPIKGFSLKAIKPDTEFPVMNL